MHFMEYDSPVMSMIGKITDIIWLSTLWFVCCLPIITIGAATTALYYTGVKTIRKSRGYVTRTFFHAFRINFVPALGIWFLCLAGIFLFYINYIFTASMEEGSFRFFMSAVYGCMGFVALSVSCYAFPILSRCSMKCFEILRFSTGLMVKHFPYTFLMVLVLVASVMIMWYIPLTVFCIPAAGTVLFSFCMEKVLIRYTPESEKGSWYAEDKSGFEVSEQVMQKDKKI